MSRFKLLGFPACKRFAGRVAGANRSSRAEMTFKESNETPSPYDVLDRNIHGIEERSFLNEIRKLNEQLELDLPELRKLQTFNIPQESDKTKARKNYAEIRYNALTSFPGVTVPSEESCDAAVHIKVDLNLLEIPSVAKDKLRALFKLSHDENSFEFSVSDFPFISQNQKRALVLLEQLIQFSQNDSLSVSDILGDQNGNYTDAAKATRKKTSSSQLKFPQEWLDAAERKAQEPSTN